MLFFCGVEDFRKYPMADYIVDFFEVLKVRSTAMMWGATGLPTTHDPGAQDFDWWIMVGRWKWFEMEINEDLRLDYCEWENLECLF